MVDLKEFEQKAADLRVLGMKISIGQDTVYRKILGQKTAGEIFILPVKFYFLCCGICSSGKV